MLSITTDYATSTGCPEPYLRRIADAGFSHVHWCHQWCTDFLYSAGEVRQIQRWMREFGLGLLDLHAAVGPEKNWRSDREYERRAGVELVRNRMDMAARLGGDVIIMHIPVPPPPAGSPEAPAARVNPAPLLRSLDALAPHARKRSVRIAIENMPNDDFRALRELFGIHGPDYLGLCYDAGHGNIGGRGLDHLESVKDRLISVHLHDNDGASDQHKLPFSATVDWPRLARVMAGSSYRKCVSMESTIQNTGIGSEEVFLKEAFERGSRLAQMSDENRSNGKPAAPAPA